jgi:hypothetical protein
MQRYEIMPFAKGEAQAAELPGPVRLTVTTSPRHGVDHTLDVSERLRALGHGVTVHLAVRMLRDRAHLESVLERASAAGIDDLFVVGGDAAEPEGPYAEAGDVLATLAGHPLRPAHVGVGAYPEGHPLIDEQVLAEALLRKNDLADYMATQLCFDPQVLLRWLEGVRAAVPAQAARDPEPAEAAGPRGRHAARRAGAPRRRPVAGAGGSASLHVQRARRHLGVVAGAAAGGCVGGLMEVR